MSSQVERDIADAQLLASYLARNGISGVEEDINIVSSAVASTSEGGTENLPENFYQHYQRLAAGAAPVSVASLRDSLEPLKFIRIRPATLLGTSAATALLICLYVLGHLHSDWLEMTALNVRLMALPEPLTEATTKLKITEANGIKRLLDSSNDGGDTGPGGAIYKERSDRFAKLQMELAADEKCRPEITNLVYSIKLASDRTIVDLSVWPHLLSAVGFTISTNQSGSTVRADSDSRSRGLRMITNLQKVVLPMLYGSLGALVFVLRRVAKDATNRLFRRESILEHVIRPFLGAVAGFIIGWFMSPEKIGIVADTSIAPFALAFVGGYSLEPVFTLLDRLTAVDRK